MTDTTLDARVEIPEDARAKALSLGSASTHAVARLGRVGMTVQGRAQAIDLLVKIAEDALVCRSIILADMNREEEDIRARTAAVS